MAFMDFSGWWRCCCCSREVNWYLCDRICPDCGKEQCEECGIIDFNEEGWGVTGGFSQKNSIAVSNIHHLRAKPRHLQMYLHDHLVDTFADSGCEINCITEEYARLLGAIVKPKVRKFKLPIKGRFLKSSGSTTLRCRFPTSPNMNQRVSFMVFPLLACHVIFGMEFLSVTGTLDVHIYRLTDIDIGSIAPGLQTVRSVGEAEAVYCWLGGKAVQCLPDTGSEVNLVSLDFAKTLQPNDSNGDPIYSMNKLESISVQFADCSTAVTVGTIKITISFLEPSQCLPSTHELVRSFSPGIGEQCHQQVPVNSKIEETFHILDNLEYDTILGDTLLATVDAFNQHFRHFVSSRQRSSDSILIARETTGKEKKSQTRTIRSEEQKIRNDYSDALDCCQDEMEKIQERLLYRKISQEQVPGLEASANENFWGWIRLNESRFRDFWQEQHVELFPQESA